MADGPILKYLKDQNGVLVIAQTIDHVKGRIQGKIPKGKKRSKSWRLIRKIWLEENPTCCICGSKEKLEVHHIVPFHVDPSKELDMNNLATVCERKKFGINCHLLVGHLGNYKRYNPNFRSSASFIRRWLVKP